MYHKNTTITIAGAAIFSAISLVFAITLSPIVPRLPGWGIAIIDPISIVWVLCFLIFGFTAAIICTTAGFIGLFFVDPFVPWGPIFKLLATIPIIIVPFILLKIKYYKNSNSYYGTSFKSPRIYALSVFPGVIIRSIIMVFANLLFIPIIFGPTAIEMLGGPLIVIMVAIGINLEQSIWDLVIPWVITYPTGIYELYKFW